MKVKCIHNTAAALPEGVYAYRKESEFNITPGKEYTVYGITTFKRFQWYLVCEDHYEYLQEKYPTYIFAGCFTISDGRLSKFWKVAEDKDVYTYNERTIIFGFEELISEPNFYSNLLEAEERETRIFTTIKKVIDEEYEWL